MVAGEEVIVAVIFDLAVVAHRPGRNGAIGGSRRQHRKVDVAHLFGNIFELQVTHLTLPLVEGGTRALAEPLRDTAHRPYASAGDYSDFRPAAAAAFSV